MKRIVSILGLALGMSMSSYATLINNVGGPTGNLASGGAALITFDEVAYPIGAFSSLPFTVTQGANTFTGTIQWLNNVTPAAPCFGSTNCGGIYTATANGAYQGGDRSLGNERVSNFFHGPTGANNDQIRSNYANTLRITFTSGNIGEFGILIRNNDSRASGGSTFTSGLNYMIVNYAGGGNSGNQSLPNQYGDFNTSNFFGWNGNATGGPIASVDFVITGLDSSTTRPIDLVTFDDLRIFASTAGTTTSGGSTTSGGGGAIPEPSTYALIGAGLAALAYARRRRQ
jgi:hypothetical protein